MDTILGILPGESYSGILVHADLSVCVKYTNRVESMLNEKVKERIKDQRLS